jgi:AraC family transcriptional regulator of adaptative response/methylated-DNA-[protein]-cysteine methyltransferase
LEAGLSGPGRLHDLLVTLEAASPGEWKNHGANLQIHWGFGESPFGPCSIGWNARGICHLSFVESTTTDDEPPELTRDWAAANRKRDDRAAQRRCEAIFNRHPGSATQLKAYVHGTPFQVKVWRALLQIPRGCLTSYGELARTIGAPNSVRAVGTACGRNPIGFLIPCHRVIRGTGIVQGYRWGEARKRVMVAWEAPQFPPTKRFTA